MRLLKHIIRKTYKEVYKLKEVPIDEQNIDYHIYYEEVSTYFDDLLELLSTYKNPNMKSDTVFSRLP